MRNFTYYQPTEIIFGRGELARVGQQAARFGRRVLVVTTPRGGFIADTAARVEEYLRGAGLEAAFFDGVIPNPTTDVVNAGARAAREFGADVVLGLGGGSSMDTAKAVAVGATHPGTAWDYLFFKTPPTEKTLPVVAVTTTSGTGSQVTQVAVITEPETNTKSAIYHPLIYPRVAIVDPDLTASMPPHITASTGFDAFCHAFESYLHVGATPYTDMMALEAIRLVARYLPRAVKDGSDGEARQAMAWADTLAGLCIANAGVTLPHGIGMTIGGYCPQVMHGEALAVTYPEFTRFTLPAAARPFAAVGRIFDPELARLTDEDAAACFCDVLDGFQKEIGMWLSLKGLGVPEGLVPVIAAHSQVLPDYLNNPRIATREDILAMLQKSYDRQPGP